MASEYQIKKALNYQLNLFQTANPTIQVAWENINYSPTVSESGNTPYIQPFFIPAESAQSGIGTDSRNRFVGVYQLTVNTTANKGTFETDSIYDLLKPYFKRGTVITYDSIQVRITKMYTGSSITQEPWYKQVINIEFRSDIDN